MRVFRRLSLARFNNLPIKAKILMSGGIVGLFTLLFVIGAFTNYRSAVTTQGLTRALDRLDHQRELVMRAAHGLAANGENAAALRERMNDLETALSGYLARRGEQANRAADPSLPALYEDLAAQVETALATPTRPDAAAALGSFTAIARANSALADRLHHLIASTNARAEAQNRTAGVELGTLFALLLLALATVSYWMYRNVALRLDRMNRVITDMESAGDLSLRLETDWDDELGHLARACNNLAADVSAMLDRQRQEKADLDEMIDMILDVVAEAAKGNLTREMMDFHGDKGIDRLANSTREMIQHLNTLITEVRESSFAVTQATSEIGASATQQEATATELAATSKEISASATEIASTSKHLVQNVEQVYGVMQSTADAAQSGHQGIQSMGTSMQAMVEAVDTISSKLEMLNEKAANINVVVNTITKVADQTNLLSLNAAIEAEKAGEYGKGFAVVATEIRRLADQTAVSTWDIEQIVKEIRSATSSSVMAMEKVSEEIHQGADNVGHVGGQLGDIIEQVRALLPEFESVKDTIHSQSEGADQISESIHQMNDSAQETADALRRTNHAVHRLKETVDVLNNGVARFRIQ